MINHEDFIDMVKPMIIQYFAPENQRGAHEYLELRALAEQNCQNINEKMQFAALWLNIDSTKKFHFLQSTDLNEQQQEEKQMREASHCLVDSEAFKPNKELTEVMKEKARKFVENSGVWLALFVMF